MLPIERLTAQLNYHFNPFSFFIFGGNEWRINILCFAVCRSERTITQNLRKQLILSITDKQNKKYRNDSRSLFFLYWSADGVDHSNHSVDCMISLKWKQNNEWIETSLKMRQRDVSWVEWRSICPINWRKKNNNLTLSRFGCSFVYLPELYDKFGKREETVISSTKNLSKQNQARGAQVWKQIIEIKRLCLQHVFFPLIRLLQSSWLILCPSIPLPAWLSHLRNNGFVWSSLGHHRWNVKVIEGRPIFRQMLCQWSPFAHDHGSITRNN